MLRVKSDNQENTCSFSALAFGAPYVQERWDPGMKLVVRYYPCNGTHFPSVPLCTLPIVTSRWDWGSALKWGFLVLLQGLSKAGQKVGNDGDTVFLFPTFSPAQEEHCRVFLPLSTLYPTSGVSDHQTCGCFSTHPAICGFCDTSWVLTRLPVYYKGY